MANPAASTGEARVLTWADLAADFAMRTWRNLQSLRRSLSALLVGSTFVLIGNLLEELFQGTVLQNVRYAFLVAGFISAGLMAPIQKWFGVQLNRVRPGLGAVQTPPESERGMEIYEAQLRFCLLDGTLTPKEVELLRRLRDSLRVTPDELRRIAGRYPPLEAAQLLAPAGEPAPAANGGPRLEGSDSFPEASDGPDDPARAGTLGFGTSTSGAQPGWTSRG